MKSTICQPVDRFFFNAFTYTYINFYKKKYIYYILYGLSTMLTKCLYRYSTNGLQCQPCG